MVWPIFGGKLASEIYIDRDNALIASDVIAIVVSPVCNL